MMSDPLEKRLIEALKSVDAHGDVAPAHVHDPMTMLLRENAIQANLMRWDDVRGRYVLTGTGRRRTVEGSRAPGTVVSFRNAVSLAAVRCIGNPPTPISRNSRSRGWISLDGRPRRFGHVSGTILIYGATGYTGKLIAKAAADAGGRPILAGRPPAVRERAGTAKVRPSRRFSGTPMNACLGRIARLQGSPREGPESLRKPSFHCVRENASPPGAGVHEEFVVREEAHRLGA